MISDIGYGRNTDIIKDQVFQIIHTQEDKILATNLKYALPLLCLLLFAGCSSSSVTKLGDISYDEEKDQTYIIDDWYRQEGATMAKLGFWGRILKEGGKVKFQPVGRLADSFEIDRYPLRVSELNHVEFKKLVVNVKKIEPTYGNIETIKGEEYDLIVLMPSELLLLEKKLNSLFHQEDEQIINRITSENFRFVSKVITVLNHDKAELLFSDIAGNLTLLLENSVAKIEFKNRSGKTESMNLYNGQIIAYQLSRICWKDGNIVETVEDRGLEVDNCSPFDGQHKKK